MGEVGGRVAALAAAAAGTAWAVGPWDRAAGRGADRPVMMRVKKIPMDSTMAAFWLVVAMPAPWPRWSGGRLFMMAARFGDANRPIASPLASSSTANQG